MPQVAYLESGPDERRRSPRKTLRLSASSETAAGDRTQVIVHDISETGLLLEGPITLAEGEELDVILPKLGSKRVTVAWASARFFGCRFAEEIPAEAAGGMDSIPEKGSPEAVSLAAVQLHELSMAIERISRVLDRAINHLSKRDG